MRTHLSALAATVLLLLSAGCGEDTASGAVLGDPARPTASGPETSDAPTGSDDPTTDGDTTPPGTELSYGDAATVELETFTVGDEGPGLAEWTVNSVEPGKEDSSGVIHPFRVNITLTAVTDISTAFVIPSLDFEGLDSAGDDTIFNVEPGCDDKVDLKTLAPGDSVEICVSVAAFNEGDLTEIRYTGGEAYDEDRGQPIVWKP
jgi:hypothetical protein